MRNLPAAWLSLLPKETALLLNSIESQLEEMELSGKTIYPPSDMRYSAFCADPSEIRVILAGQDPYFNENQATGLSFSVKQGTKLPPSLKNIFKELVTDIGCPMPLHGDLAAWSKQGVLLLNAVLSVESGKPLSHNHLGWDRVTGKIIEELSNLNPQIIFVLWGKNAQNLEPLINKSCLIIKSSHPSPMGGSCNRGFFGSRPFSRINNRLIEIGQKPIIW